MKAKRFKFSLVILTLIAGQLSWAAQDDLTKTVDKTYEINSSTELSINNKYGKVHIDTWDRDLFEIKVEVIVKDYRQDRGQRILDAIDIDITESAQKISFRTEIGSIRGNNNGSMEINYTIKMPGSNPLDLKNSFGSAFVDNRSGRTRLDIAYGSLRAGDFDGEVDMKISFSKGSMGRLDHGDLEIKYSDFSITSSNELNLDQQFSDLEIEQVGYLKMDSKYGDIEIEEANSIDAEVGFSGFSIGRLNEGIDLKASYVGGFEIEQLSKDFTSVYITGKFGSYSITVEQGLSAEFRGEFQFSDLDDRDDVVDLKYRVKESNKSEYRGSIGGGDPNRKIEIYSSYGNLRLEY